MNSIGFKNFRRFANFPEIDLGDVTILVGGNNSGKSTLVKALLLCVDNLRLMRINDRRHGESKSPLLFNKPLFRFDANEYHDVKIKEFARAIHNKPVEEDDVLETIFIGKKKKSLPTTIVFKFTLGQFRFTFRVSGNRDERSTTGNVDYIEIEDKKAHVKYTNNYDHRSMSYAVLNTDFEEQKNIIQKLGSELKAAKKALDKANVEGDLETITSMTTSLDKIKMQIKSMLDIDSEDDNISEDELWSKIIHDFIKKNRPEKVHYTVPLSLSINEVAEPVVLNVISNILSFATSKKSDAHQEKSTGTITYLGDVESISLEDDRKNMALDKDIFIKSRHDLEQLLDSLSVEYISAHAANQNTLYNTADENDYIAMTVHNFWREKINPGDSEYEFVREWMQKFEIGIDFKIEALVPGEAYTVSISEEDGSVVSLADKGMGSIQMMILLLRLATILYSHKPKNYIGFREWASPVIVIEEPEQNLHPKMQSFLADLFHHLASYENCKFLIETHSEYIIRKSQVIVSDDNYVNEDELKENNKFKVYYLPSDGAMPYEMQYRIDGKFSNEFGEGFFDEANKLLFDIL